MNFPTMTYQVDFAHDPSSASFTWTDLTARALSFSCTRGRSHEQATIDAGSAAIEWKNTDGVLDPTNTGGTYYPNVIPYRRVQVKAVYNSVTYNIYTGLVERWPLQWHEEFGTVPSQCPDIFSLLANKTLRTVYVQEVLLDGPLAFYPLTEAAGATSAGDISGNGAPSLAVQTTVGGDATFGGATGISTDATSTLSLNKTLTNAASDDFNGMYLESLTTLSGATSNVTIDAWVSLDPNLATDLSRNTTNLIYLVELLQYGVSNFAALLLGYNAGGVYLWDPIAGATVGTNLNDGGVHHLAFVNNSSGSSRRFYVDGVQVSTGAAAVTPATSPNVHVGGFVGPLEGFIPSNIVKFRGGIGYVAIYPTALSSARITAHYTAGKTAFLGETANTRIARLLSYAGWTATVALDTCTTTMLAATDIKGQSALAAIQAVEASEGGTFYVGKDGTLTYKSRTTRMSTTASSYTFGDGTSELPYTSVAFDYDPTFIYNDIQITRTGSATAVAADTTSQGHYGVRTYAKTLSIQSDAEALDAANWDLNIYKTPHLRVSSITLDPSATAALWPACLNMDIGTRVTVKRRAHGSSNTISADFFVEQITHNVQNAGVWRTTLALSPVALQPLIADDTTFGICDSTFVAAY